eukprot:Ihof_evm3s205 gene=Ihof_evmTU3s205
MCDSSLKDKLIWNEENAEGEKVQCYILGDTITLTDNGAPKGVAHVSHRVQDGPIDRLYIYLGNTKASHSDNIPYKQIKLAAINYVSLQSKSECSTITINSSTRKYVLAFRRAHIQVVQEFVKKLEEVVAHHKKRDDDIMKKNTFALLQPKIIIRNESNGYPDKNHLPRRSQVIPKMTYSSSIGLATECNVPISHHLVESQGHTNGYPPDTYHAKPLTDTTTNQIASTRTTDMADPIGNGRACVMVSTVASNFVNTIAKSIGTTTRCKGNEKSTSSLPDSTVPPCDRMIFPIASVMEVVSSYTTNTSDFKENDPPIPLNVEEPTNMEDNKPRPLLESSIATKRHLEYGIQNEGSTCYMASTLQMIGSFKTFLDQLIQPNLLNKLEMDHENTCITRELIKFYKSRRLTSHGNGPSHVIGLLKAFSRHALFRPFSQPYVQQDAHEFLSQLLDCIGDEVCRSSHIQGTSLDDEGHHHPHCPVETNFQYEMEEETRCQVCGSSSISNTPDRILCLANSGSSTNRDTATSIRNLLEQYFMDTVLQDTWQCEVCGAKNARQTRKLTKIPRALIIQVKRYIHIEATNERVKLTFPLLWSDYLNMADYCSRRDHSPFISSLDEVSGPDNLPYISGRKRTVDWLGLDTRTRFRRKANQ